MKTRFVMVIMLLVACSDNFNPFDHESTNDLVATEAMIGEIAKAYATVVDDEQPARVMLGTWESLAGADHRWGARLESAIRTITEDADRKMPDAPWLFSFQGATAGKIKILVVDRDDPERCCVIFYVNVQLAGDSLVFDLDDDMGIADIFAPVRMIRETEEYEEGVRRRLAEERSR